jgi:hypothetical protein
MQRVLLGVALSLAVVGSSACSDPEKILISPSAPTIPVSATQQFTAAITSGGSRAPVWSVAGTGSGTITVGGLYAAPATPGSFVVTVTDPVTAVQASVTVTVFQPGVLIISPASTSVPTSGTQQFSATEMGTVASVAWTVSAGGAGGTISSSGLYTAPQSAGTDTVVATSLADATVIATATVTVTQALPTITISPTTVSLVPFGTQQFTASVAATWSLTEGAAGGTVSGSGVYMAPANPGTFHVVATSTTNSAETATAVVTVSSTCSPGELCVTPASVACLAPDATQQFTATIPVNWSVENSPVGGTITSGGLYMAPSTGGTTFYVQATSQANSGQVVTVSVTVPISSCP